jgi:hypothetical protein
MGVDQIKPWHIYAAFTATAAVLLLSLLFLNSRLAALAFIPMLAGVWARNYRYKQQMKRLGADVIAEAKEYSTRNPGSYPAYRERAITALRGHGLTEYVSDLPAVGCQ